MMKKDKVLIITNKKDDAHADALISKCNKCGMGDRIIRFNTEEFHFNSDIMFDINNFNISIKDSKRKFKSDEIMSVWYRRPQKLLINGYSDKGVKNFIEQQTEAVMRGLYFILHDSAFWINPLPALHKARHKLPQLVLAKDIGFRVPKTIVTNNPKEAEAFMKRVGKVCNKSLDEPNYWINNKMYAYFTRKVESINEIAENKESISSCPTFFQEYIEKKSDIRVVIIGNDVIAVEISSQDNCYSQVDFRGASPHLLKHKKHKLPIEIEKMALEFVKKSGLVFSSMDLVIDNKGEYIFIENNCNGQWLWLDQLAGTDILDTMIKYLFQKI